MNTSDIFKNRIINGLHTIENAITGHTKEIVTTVENDVSRVIHSISVVPLAVGTDITLRLDHALGEMKRIVIQGAVTVEGLIAHIRNLTGTAAPVSTPEPTPALVSTPAPTSTPV